MQYTKGHWNMILVMTTKTHNFQVTEVSSENYSFPNLSRRVPYLIVLTVLAVATAAFDYTEERSKKLNSNAEYHPLCLIY